jgi:predicted Zn-dependent protease
MAKDIIAIFKRLAPPVNFWSLRLVDTREQGLTVRQDVLQPIRNRHSRGVFITVLDRGGIGYAATSDVSESGLEAAIEHALRWAQRTANINLLRPEHLAQAKTSSIYHTPAGRAWEDAPLEAKLAWLEEASQRLKAADAIVDWSASLTYRTTEVILLTSHGVLLEQSFDILIPVLRAVANRGSETQARSFGYDRACQGGLEQLNQLGFFEAAERVADEAVQLLYAENCPSGRMDLLLMPEQMILQIHESIGHPLELDRILGDERNYAGTSFVTPAMFGSYRYGSDLLNVTFDPTRYEQLASYGFDDEGTKAQRCYLIRAGILVQPLGSATSQQRAGLPGVANARACDWNRPPIDRMANLNVEPGTRTLDHLIQSIEYGVLMDTNRSWSIDDSRNKFQFGCEYGRLITEGELKAIVKNPNYRGISATFWRNLKGVGDMSTFQIMGTPTCGKGEPNQLIHVGHASPACVFDKVDVFGGA